MRTEFLARKYKQTSKQTHKKTNKTKISKNWNTEHFQYSFGTIISSYSKNERSYEDIIQKRNII